MESYEFKKEKVASYMKASELFMEEMRINHGRESDDFILEQLTILMEGAILTRLEGVQKINVYRKRPSFWEWLTRKEISIDVEINCKEIFVNPPKRSGNTFIYEIQKA